MTTLEHVAFVLLAFSVVCLWRYADRLNRRINALENDAIWQNVAKLPNVEVITLTKDAS